MAGRLTLTSSDLEYLERARLLARRGWGRAHPNPLVGCVLVRDGRVVGEAYHREFGGPHAEIGALEVARSDAEGATAYVSLEPCNHHGQTPPCSEALVQAGVSRVVYGAAEPSAEAGGGAETLRAAGVEVVGPAWDRAVGQAENPSFFHTATHDRPYIALKLAVSLDGRISAGPGVRTAITGAEAGRAVHRLRSGFDAVMVGANTLRVDDPRLTVRLVEPGRVPARRLVLDSSASIPSNAAIWDDVAEVPVHVFTSETAPEAGMERLETLGAHVHPVPAGEGGLDLDRVLEVAWEIGVRSILCEGGAALAGSLVRQGLIQRAYFFIAPLTLGPKGVPAFPSGARDLDWTRFEPASAPSILGRDTLIVLDRQEG